MTTSRPAPSSPAEPSSGPSCPSSPAAVSPPPKGRGAAPRCAALHRRCGAEPAESRSGAGSGERARLQPAPRALPTRCPAAPTFRSSRETPVPPPRPRSQLSRERRQEPVRLTGAIRGPKSSLRPGPVAGGAAETGAGRGHGGRDPGMGAWRQQPQPQLPDLKTKEKNLLLCRSQRPLGFTREEERERVL